MEQPAPGWPLAGSFKYDAREDRWEWSDEVAVMHGYEPGTVTPTTELVLSHKPVSYTHLTLPTILLV